jgi:hypothetical protein
MLTGTALIIVACSVLTGAAKSAVVTLAIFIIIAGLIRLVNAIFNKANSED